MDWRKIGHGALARITLGVVSIVAIVSGVNPQWGTFAPLSLLAIVVPVMGWLTAEIFAEADANRQVSAHDRGLYEVHLQAFTEADLEFLHNHDFGAPYDRSDSRPVSRFVQNWVGASYEFQNRRLNAKLVTCKNVARKLSHAFGYKSGPHRVMQDFNTAEVYGADGELTAESKQEIAELNELATDLCKAIDEMDRQARREGLSARRPPHRALTATAQSSIAPVATAQQVP